MLYWIFAVYGGPYEPITIEQIIIRILLFIFGFLGINALVSVYNYRKKLYKKYLTLFLTLLILDLFLINYNYNVPNKFIVVGIYLVTILFVIHVIRGVFFNQLMKKDK